MSYLSRHAGLDPADRAAACAVIGVADEAALLAAALPPGVASDHPLALPPAVDEVAVTARLRALADRNHLVAPMYGLGFWPTTTPAVIRRGVLENPAWYTAYTPYQPEISQGRLEVLMAFQTMVSDLMDLPVAGASLLDEATAVAEAVALARRVVRGGDCVVVDERVFPASTDVVETRAGAIGVPVVVAGDLEAAIGELRPFCVVVAQAGADGVLRPAAELTRIAAAAHAAGALVVVTSDLLAATLVTPPGRCGADIAVGSSQRFGIPLWYGGPSAGFIAVRAGLERQLPGRLVGLSVDADGRPAYRLALQTREQHIRREKATSNICTAQVLPAVAAAFYAMWHGPDGLAGLAAGIHRQAARFAGAARAAGYALGADSFFDTVAVIAPGRAAALVGRAHDAGIGIRADGDDKVVVTFGEGIDETVMAGLADVFGLELADDGARHLPDPVRAPDFLTHEVFRAFRSETAMMRYMRTLADRDYALDRGMIPLGSCTMKLNPAVAMEAISLPGFAGLHPYAPDADAAGYHELIATLGSWLAEITGFAAVSFQPNAGAQGEFAGLAAIRRYHEATGEGGRRVCLIPASAHGTNAASAVMAGLTVQPVAVAADGSVDVDDLAAKVAESGSGLAALMITYPSTHGVYEPGIREICEMVHAAGGQVYIDGANLNALVGLARLADLGADASHLNLHKTFALPHGGGGPGVGPLAVKAHLAPFLPGHRWLGDRAGVASGDPVGAVSSAPYGSPGILPIAYAYLAMMGADALKEATTGAVIAANYVSARLRDHFPTLYTGPGGFVAHECILDLRGWTRETGITAEDVAKRLIDYGFHAPTLSFPVPGTLMVEPTESESLAELDRFCDAMTAIAAEMAQVRAGVWDAADNPLRQAPHPAGSLAGEWEHPYSRTTAAYPMGIAAGPVLAGGPDKYWPPVARIDQAYGDRNLVVKLS